MVPILGIASFVLWLYALSVMAGDGRVHLLLVGAVVALVSRVIQHRRAVRRAPGHVVSTQSRSAS